jgi:hypothetical protein
LIISQDEIAAGPAKDGEFFEEDYNSVKIRKNLLNMSVKG